MKGASWVMFLVGTLMGAGAGARPEPHWPVFAVGIVLALVGALMLRRVSGGAPSGKNADGSARISNLPDLRAALERMVDDVGAAADLGEDAALKTELERILLERMLPLVDARVLLSSAHGVEAYAKVFTPFASGERCLNRAWSALVDGVPSETRVQIVSARQHLEIALAAWPASA